MAGVRLLIGNGPDVPGLPGLMLVGGGGPCQYMDIVYLNDKLVLKCFKS